jgi:predicted DsbA family dithiol-disulfide isomerase
LYTDPGCPFGFNAQRQELQLMWHYGHAAEIERRMIVLRERSMDFGEGPGPTAEMVTRGRERLARLYGMPMGLEPVPRLAATIDACRAYVGARVHAPDRALALLRSLRRRAHSDQQALDERETVAGAARDAGLGPELVDAWLADGGIEAQLRADMAATRDPLPEALALPYRLSRSATGLRYSTSSGVFEHNGLRIVAAGFQPFAVYEVAMANVAPGVERRPTPETVGEVLAWAPFALATAEVAELRGIELPTARAELERAGARFTASANDGYWAP